MNKLSEDNEFIMKALENLARSNFRIDDGDNLTFGQLLSMAKLSEYINKKRGLELLKQQKSTPRSRINLFPLTKEFEYMKSVKNNKEIIKTSLEEAEHFLATVCDNVDRAQEIIKLCKIMDVKEDESDYDENGTFTMNVSDIKQNHINNDLEYDYQTCYDGTYTKEDIYSIKIPKYNNRSVPDYIHGEQCTFCAEIKPHLYYVESKEDGRAKSCDDCIEQVMEDDQDTFIYADVDYLQREYEE